MVKTTKLFTMHSSLAAKRICALTPSLESLGGIDKRFAEISGEIPEFAGYYLDADGDLVTMAHGSDEDAGGREPDQIRGRRQTARFRRAAGVRIGHVLILPTTRVARSAHRRTDGTW